LSKGYKTKEKLQISSKYWALEIGKWCLCWGIECMLEKRLGSKTFPVEGGRRKSQLCNDI
jgi:hypothetical protein